MRDFNFFRSYQKQPGKSDQLKRWVALGCAGLILIVAAVYGLNAYRIHQLESDMQRMNTFMSAPENIKKYQKYLKTKERLALLTKYFKVADRVNRLVDNDARLDYEMMATLSGAMPTKITLQSSKMDAKNMEFQGVTDSRMAVAEFEHNLIETDYFENVFVLNIDQAVDTTLGTPKAGYYVFSVKCKLKEVMDK